MQNLNFLLEDNEISVLFDMDDLTIKGNHKLLYQALYNILNNAIKYSPKYSMIQIDLKNKMNL